MKILLITPSLKHGGAERVISLLANQWAALGHEIHLVILVKSHPFYQLDKSIITHELNFVNSGRISQITNGLNVFIKLRKLYSTVNADFVLSFITKYNLLSLSASYFTSQRVFVSDRNSPELPLSWPVKILKKIAYSRASGIIAQTQLARKIIKKETGNQNIQVIKNPVKEIVISNSIQKEKIILNIGSLHPQKGQKYLLEAFSKLQNKHWRLVILGEGLLRGKLEQYAFQLGIADKVEMPGVVQDIDTWLAKASIFAFSSQYEGFPNALAEAMASGLPCVSFDCDTGPSDMIIDGKNGFLVPTNDIEQFSMKIQYLIDAPEIREIISSEAKKIASRLHISKIANQYLEFCSTRT